MSWWTVWRYPDCGIGDEHGPFDSESEAWDDAAFMAAYDDRYPSITPPGNWDVEERS